MTRHLSVIDDDESVRESLPHLLRSFGFSVDAFASPYAFLGSDILARTECLVLDVAMPEMTGPDLFVELQRRKRQIPIIFITAHADNLAPRFRRAAAACLLKPFTETSLLTAVESVFQGGAVRD